MINGKMVSGVKNKLNIVGRGYVKENSAGGEIISFIPDVPISGWLDNFLFILTVPNEEQKYAPAYCRLQDKSQEKERADEVAEFTEVRTVGYFKQKKGDIIVCAPKTHVWVDMDKLVVIATIPAEGKNVAPVYIKPKKYEKNKSELLTHQYIEETASAPPPDVDDTWVQPDSTKYSSEPLPDDIQQ